MVVVFLSSVVQVYGYAGIFIASLIGSATIILPVPYLLLIFSSSSVLNPFLVGVIAGVGSSIGELTSYFVGVGGSKTILKKYKKQFNKIEKVLENYKGDLGILLLSVAPIPFDLVGIFCGTINYNIKRFFIITIIGKIVKHLIIAYAGFYGIHWIFSTFAWG